ncbi:MAG: site-specific integrase, partial [Hyphomicrobiales bacterium]|nr:site-specific integrase [Hyphomicrobiales bacterium]
DEFRAKGNTTAEPATPEWRSLARMLAGVQLEVLDRVAERDAGNFAGKPQHPALSEPPNPAPTRDAMAVRILCPDSTKPLSQLAEQCAEEKGAKSATAYEYAVAARMFEELLGEAKPAYRITRRDVIEYKNALRETPSNYTKRFPDRTLPAAIAANKDRKLPFPTLNVTTINDKWIPRLHSLLQWCVNNEIIPDNPAAGVKVERKAHAGAPSREPFTPGDLTKIFGPPGFVPRKPYGEKQWALLIALFTGMRASEIAQLKLDSVRHERGILCFAIEEETKNQASRRLTPAHSTLIALGLEKRVASLRAARRTHLFPDWFAHGERLLATARATNKVVKQPFSQIIPRWFNRTYLPKVDITDDRKVFHCFRHTLKTALARAGVPRSVSDDITGHDDSTAGGAYIHDTSIEAMKEAIERLQFDGFNLKQ